MPDVIAEQGALQDAIESPSTSVSRLGAAGWMKGKVADLNAIGVTENVSRLAAAGRIMGGIYDADPLATSTFFAPLKTTLVLSRGTGNPTFTRATTAYVTDFEGLLKQVPSGCARFTGARMVRNLILTNSVTYAATGSVTLTAGQTDPNGGALATKVVCAATGMGNRATSNITAATPVGNSGQISIYLKGELGGESIKISDGFIAGTTVALTTAWRRYSVSVTFNSSAGLYVFANSGTPTFYAAFNQVEDVTGQSNQNPSEYVSVGVLSAPYHGAGVDGVKYFDTENGNTVNSGIVTEATGAAIADATLKGYLAEGSQQNRCLYSQDFSNAAWVETNVNKTADGHTAPDGSATAYALTASAGNGTVIQDLGVVASATKTFTIYLKRKTGTGNIQLTLDGGSTWTTVAITSSWDRYGISQASLANEDCGIRIVTSGDAVYAWGAQVINGGGTGPSRPDRTSYVPTTSAAVTRNADLLSYPLAGNASSTSGTLYAEVTAPQAYTTAADNRIVGAAGALILANSNVASIYDGANTTSTANAATDFAATKLASAYSGSTTSVVLNGGTVVNGTFTGSVNLTPLYIGNGNGWILVKNVKAWTKRLPDSTIKNMTT